MSLREEFSPRLIHIIVDKVRTSSPEFFNCLSGYQHDVLRQKILRAGFNPSDVRISLLRDCAGVEHTGTIVGLGEDVLRHFTDKRGIDKWVLSPLRSHGGNWFIPAYDFGRTQKQYELGLYNDLALRRAFEISDQTSPWPTTTERFLLNPSLEETHAVLKKLAAFGPEDEIAVDVETGYGQINTVGFAWSPADAIAINVLPDRCNDSDYFRLWSAIRDTLEAPSRKILQNFIYDTSYFSAYGIDTQGEIFDTMWAMKVLWPELKSNLGNVGRIYTRRPYWKDDGKVTDEEGQKKDWGAVRDWVRHYTYNARDTTGTLEASIAQRRDLTERGLDEFFAYVKRLVDPIREMCATGIPVSQETRARLITESETALKEFTREFHLAVGAEINPSSPKQILSWLRDSGVSLPKKFDKVSGGYKESTDAGSIKKIRLKNDRPGLKELQEIKYLKKAISSYLDFELRPDGRLSYSLNGAGTETLRWSGNKDPWDRGLNIQTLPRDTKDGISIKSMFEAPEGYSFVECDLRQAESRFVAYDSADHTLIDMLESGADVHSHVGTAILRQMGKDPSLIGKDEFKATWRQLGKKAGHGLNYGMKAGVFVETVFNELDLVITKKDAELITQAYFGLFPGIPRWHAWVKGELYNKRKLSAPSGWERYFYGRYEDALKEALAWRPQHTIPWITNHLLLHLCDERKHDKLEFQLLFHGHDALYALVPDDSVEGYARTCLNYKVWSPPVTLPGGELRIPTEVKYGRVLANMEEFIA